MKTNLLLENTGSKWCNLALKHAYRKAESKGLKNVDKAFFFDILAEIKQKHENLNTLSAYKKGLYYGLKKLCARNKNMNEFEKLKPVFDEFKVKTPGRVYHHEDYITLQEFAKLRKSCSQKEGCILDIFSLSGMRLGECLNIKFTDIKILKGKCQIILKKTKSKKHRLIILPSEVIRRTQKAFKSKTYLLENEFGRQLNRRAVQKMFQRMSKRIGKRITPHLMRHWFINQRAEDASLFEVQSLASYVGNTFSILVKHYLSGKFKENNSYQPVKRKIDRELNRQKKKK